MKTKLDSKRRFATWKYLMVNKNISGISITGLLFALGNHEYLAEISGYLL